MKDATARRFTDLTSVPGTGWGYAWALVSAGAAVGGLIGWPFRHPGPGAAVGFALGFVVWHVLQVIAHRQLAPYKGQHRDDEPTAQGLPDQQRDS